MKSKYTGPKNQAKNQTVPISIEDPRLSWLKIGQTKARTGAEIEIVGLDGKNLVMGGSYTTGSGNSAVVVQEPPAVIIPGGDNKPPINYPGGSGPYIIVLTDPTGVTATWSGDTLNVSFNWDASNAANATASQFVVKLTSSAGITAQTPFNTFSPISAYNTGGTSYTLPVTKTMITSMFNIFTTGFTSACVMVADPYNNLNATGMVCTTSVGSHVFAVNPPKIQLTSINSGYTVLYGEDSGTYGAGTALGTFPTGANAVDIWELEGSSSPTPTITLDGSGNPTGWSRVYLGTLDPVNIIAPNVNGRWVAARFNSASGERTAFCTPLYITPTPPVTVNTKVPTTVSSVTGTWSGNDIVINYTLPGATASVTNVSGNGSVITYTAANTFAAGNVVSITGVNPTAYNITGTIVSATSTQFTVAGTTTTAYVSGGSASSTDNSGVRFIAVLNAPTGAKGYFYIYPDGTTSLSQTYTIRKADLFAQFGTYYSSFSGSLFQSVSITGAQDTGYSFNIGTRANPLATTTASFTSTAIANGYIASFSLPSAATYGEVYQKFTTWGSTTAPSDLFTSTYSSGGSSGTNTIVVNNVKDEHGTVLTTIPTGYTISGVGIPTGTFVSAVSGTSTLTLTLSTYNSSGTVVASNLTTQASGDYTMTALVYSGFGPATISSPLYGNTYVTVRYYDDWKNGSILSAEQVLVPINPAVVDNTVPNAPTIGTVTSTTTSTLTFPINTSDSTTKGYRLRYKQTSQSDSYYTTILVSPLSAFSGGSSSTSYTLTNLIPGTSYTINAAGYNQYNGVGAYSSSLVTSTTSSTAPGAPTLGTPTSQPYSFLLTWTAPSVSGNQAAISQYKVELYNSLNTLLFTDYTYSTNYSFIGLKASTTYYAKVYTQDIYSNLSTAATSSNVTFNSVGQTTDGSAPSSSPTPTVNPLYGGLEVKWTAISNADPVTYEVHVSTTTGFTPSSGTKAVETSGTFAVIKTLPGTSTALTYGTVYYVKLIAKDFDGSAAAGTQGSATTLQIDNGDIAANAIRANVIQAGTITATEINSSSLLIGKLFAVGAGSGDTNPIKIDASGTVTKLYSGTGTYGNANTPFYLDTTGQFSIKDKLTFDGNTTLTVNGVIKAQSGDFVGAMTVNNGTMKIGTAAGGSGNNGIYINAYNYHYDNGYFAAGASGNGIMWDGTNFNITGGLTAPRGAFTGPLLIGGNGYIMAASSATITNVVASAGSVTYTTSAAHGFTVGQTVTIVGVIPGAYNLTNQTITAVTTVSPFTFTISNAATGTYSYGGTAMITSGASSRIQIANTAITAYDAGGNATTQIVSNAANGANTFTTTRAKIADWTITDTKIESTLVTGITKYTGLSASNTSYAFWAGATSAGNTDATAPFSVTPTGQVNASNIAVSGGTVDIGSATKPLTLTTSAAQVSAGTGLTFTSTTGVAAGMIVYAYAGTGTPLVPLNTTVSSFTGTTVTLSASTYSAVPSGTVIVFQPASGAHITSGGSIFGTDTYFTGKLNANGGYLNGNVLLSTSGSLYSPQVAGTVPANGTAGGTIFNSNGVAAYTTSTGTYSALLATPLTANGVSYNLFSTAAYLGGWSIDTSRIIKTGISGKGNIVLDSAGGYIYVSDTTVPTYTAGINSVSSAANGTTSGVAFWAGSATSSNNPDPAQLKSGAGAYESPYINNFVVRSDGSLYAKNANMYGNVTSYGSLGAIYLSGNNQWLKFEGTYNAQTYKSFILPRNNNIYIIAPGTQDPWSSTTGDPGTTGKITTAPTTEPYFAAGGSFNDPWGNSTSGIGIYTGNWDYFTSGASDPFITVAKSGTIQLSASPDIGLIVEKGGATGDSFTTPTILMYTSKNATTPYKPSTSYGAWMTFQKGYINVSASSTTFISVFGDTQTGTSWPTGSVANTITIQANANRDRNVSKLSEYTGGVTVNDGFDSAYRGASKISVTSTGVRLSGSPFISDMNVLTTSFTGSKGTFVGLSADYMKYYDIFNGGSGTGYLNIPGLGPLPRARALVEDPSTGEMKLGFAIYYQDTSIDPQTPSGTSGYVGDLWLQY